MVWANDRGYYLDFGGAFVPEMLRPNIMSLLKCYREAINDDGFWSEFNHLLNDYAGRPSPLTFAARFSEKIGCRLFLKREDCNHTGSHKINNTLGQVLIAERLGKRRIIAETGAGQHGVATATVCALRGLECTVFMGAIDVERQLTNVKRMEMLGARVERVQSGSRVLKDATNEAIRNWITHPHDTHYIIGSAVGPHPYPEMVARFQSVISEEIKNQLKVATGKDTPNFVVACVGGGSNAIGSFYHYIDSPEVELVGVEAAGEGLTSGRSAATLALGSPGVLHGSKTVIMQDDSGQITEAHSISAGLDYPGIGPQHAALHASGRARYEAVTDEEALEAAWQLAQLEGIVPALESAHAVAWVLKAKQELKDKDVVLCLSGRGDKDIETYLKYGERRGL